MRATLVWGRVAWELCRLHYVTVNKARIHKARIMKLTIPVLALALSSLAPTAYAETVVINDRYIVCKDQVRGYFYRDSSRRTVFDVRWSDWSVRYLCEEEYDQTRVKAASLNFALQLDGASSLDFAEFLSGEGLGQCEAF